MGKGFAKKKKEARAMQNQLVKMQEDMKNLEVTGTAGNGLVTVTLNGENELKKITIKPECVDKDDIEGLQDLIKAAFQDANKKVQQNMPLSGIPGMSGLFGGGSAGNGGNDDNDDGENISGKAPGMMGGFPDLSRFGF